MEEREPLGFTRRGAMGALVILQKGSPALGTHPLASYRGSGGGVGSAVFGNLGHGQPARCLCAHLGPDPGLER